MCKCSVQSKQVCRIAVVAVHGAELVCKKNGARTHLCASQVPLMSSLLVSNCLIGPR